MKLFFTSLICFVSITLIAQTNVFKNLPDNYRQDQKPVTLGPLNDFSQHIEKTARLQNVGSFKVPKSIDFNLLEVQIKKIGHSVWIEGSPKKLNANIRHRYAQAYNYLDALKEQLPFDNTEKSFTVATVEKDRLGMNHYRMQQMHEGIKVFSGEMILHEKEGSITHANGRLFSIEKTISINPAISLNNALEQAYFDLGEERNKIQNKFTQLLELEDQGELVIYPYQNKNYLAYHLEIHAAHDSHWKYFIDATSGEIINKYSTVCGFFGKELAKAAKHLHTHTDENPVSKTISSRKDLNKNSSELKGPAVGNGLDLFGQNREVHSFEEGGTYYMVDVTRKMFKNLGDQNNPPQGIIQTYDAQNKKFDDKFSDVLTITSNSADWNYPTAVSAHTNAAIVYEYFKDTHIRDSYNGQGANLISFINVVEEDNVGFDNAYWGGAAMFYGNGDFQFEKLPAGLDVAAHEMGHGTIFSSAGLEYQDESGALNESFADIFGAMVDRDDWKIGDDVALSSFFPSGTMRDMANPHNGGNQLGQPGYQPQFYHERYTGEQDNGGVHINSGIVNYAAYLIGETIGKDKLEQIYYRALIQYLTRSSQFIDCRNGVIQAAKDLYGNNSNEAQVAGQAFDEVGIIEGQVEDNPDPQQDVEANQGVQVISYIDTDDGRINLTLTDGSDIAEGLTNFVPISRPSITDNGAFLVYVSDDLIMRYIAFDWNNETYDIGTIEQDPQAIWRNVVISKDGTKLAALTAEQDNSIYIIDLVSGSLQPFTLTNPGTQEGIFNDNVLRADAMEFDFTGEFLMYDAESELSTYTYWDIGFLHVWDNASNSFGSGKIFKLVEGLPETVSIGNPTFAKNSPYVIALDYVEIVNDQFFGPTPEYSVYGFNIETYEYAAIVSGGGRLGFPNYGPADDYLMYTGASSDIVFDGISTLFAAPLNPDKITFADIGDILQFKQYANWANWFAIGQRDFSTTSIKPNALADNHVKVFPNPALQDVRIDFELKKPSPVQIQVRDVLGQSHYQFRDQMSAGQQQHRLDISNLASGVYFIQMELEGKRGSVKVVKE